jgi:hypothetical protein
MKKKFNHYILHVKFPNIGKYNLDIFAKRPHEESYSCIISYTVEAIKGVGMDNMFPIVYRIEGGELIEPLDGQLTIGTAVTFKYKCLNAESVMLAMDNGKQIEMDCQAKDQIWKAEDIDIEDAGAIKIAVKTKSEGGIFEESNEEGYREAVRFHGIR